MLYEEKLIADGYSIKNAKITSVSITMADHGCLCYWIMLEGDVWGCGFGGYAIGNGCLGAKDPDFKAETGDGLIAMMRIMNVVGVSKWEDLEGQFVRVAMTDNWGSSIHIIGNILNDKWFDQKKFFAECRNDNKEE
jgi:hypothetical protein